MTRTRRYGKWQSRGVRFLALLQSAIAMLRIWWLMTWHRKMWLLWAWEDVPRDRRSPFAEAIARAVVRAWVAEMSSTNEVKAGEAMMDRTDYDDAGNLDDVVIENVRMFRLEYMDENRILIRLYRDNKRDLVFHLEAASKIAGGHYED